MPLWRWRRLFTEQGGVTVEAAPTRKQSVEITISDTGISIPAELGARMFEPFQQGATAPAAGPNGVGLGLYIVRRLLSVLGGTIMFTSEPGRGTMFRLCIPMTNGLGEPQHAAQP
jgi:signal transduction histidine kinase